MSDYQKIKEDYDNLKEHYKIMRNLLMKLITNLDEVSKLNKTSNDLLKSLLRLDMEFSEKE